MLAQANAYRIPLAAGSVHCICTSPPYWGQRRYAGQQSFAWPGGAFAPWPGLPECVEIPGSDEAMLAKCHHVWSSSHRFHASPIRSGDEGLGFHDAEKTKSQRWQTDRYCRDCGAWRGGLGQEPVPEMFIWHILLVMREVRRVLRADGVCYFDIGDGFASQGKGSNAGRENSGLAGGFRNQEFSDILPQGNLVGIPAMLFKCLQADGWIVRNDLVWHKIAPMPESLNGTRFEAEPCGCIKTKQEAKLAFEMQRTGADRHRAGLYDRDETLSLREANPDCPDCGGTGRVGEPKLTRGSWRHTRAHEFVFMLVKQMGYWSDAEAVKERGAPAKPARNFGINSHRDDSGKLYSSNGQGRNPRSVRTPAPSSYSGDHFAVYPPSLIRPLIVASCPARCCPVCGAGWAPVIHSEHGIRDDTGRTHGLSVQRMGKQPIPEKGWETTTRVTGYRPTCAHPHTEQEAQPGIVLDPFCGSGTTGLVARELGRRFIGLDVSREYLRDQAAGRAEVYTLPLMAV